MNSKFPFADEPNTACFTCKHVLEEGKSILYVSHDNDGYWQFLCGALGHIEEDARIVSLSEILHRDESVSNLAQLDYGEYAESDDIGGNWIVKRR